MLKHNLHVETLGDLEPPKCPILQLKHLPHTLKYTYLKKNHVIVSANLSVYEEERLLVLKKQYSATVRPWMILWALTKLYICTRTRR